MDLFFGSRNVVKTVNLLGLTRDVQRREASHRIVTIPVVSSMKSSVSSSCSSGMQQMKSFQIATKNHDGGSNEDVSSCSSPSSLSGGRPDAFSLYSNQEVRMDRLLFRATRVVPANLIPSETGNDYMDTTSSSTTAKTHAVTSLPGQPPIRRRATRLSFEVHPSLLLDPLILLDDDEMMTTGTRPNSIFDE